MAAEKYSVGNVFCMGDAVHRHPPNHGLGSNTCIQDAHNLAWKVAYVEKGLAGKELLESYSDERQPVGLELVTQANTSLRNHRKMWEALGSLEKDPQSRVASLEELKEESPRGIARREKLHATLKLINREEHGLGIEMNQRYSSTAISKTGQGDPPTFDTNPLEYYHATTYPGARLPHVWLGKTIPSRYVSTIDLAGKGHFALFTGIGGHRWNTAIEEAQNSFKTPIKVHIIGYRQQWEDIYGDWAEIRGVEETGCVLVRPDYFVAWRCQSWSEGNGSELVKVLKSVLSIGV
ncbi:hypothetical protein PRZ48_006198 [Zasmidium cellare]|uniref:FAD-binding domain-containing protein n=1 Tax=Zasmidium cellare TaxID=395010 RepID=A0ABR0EMG6_ZASCE|nr:hypothetical protein PRZ48_006198 [Zasmidium cellare]